MTSEFELKAQRYEEMLASPESGGEVDAPRIGDVADDGNGVVAPDWLVAYRREMSPSPTPPTPTPKR